MPISAITKHGCPSPTGRSPSRTSINVSPSAAARPFVDFIHSGRTDRPQWADDTCRASSQLPRVGPARYHLPVRSTGVIRALGATPVVAPALRARTLAGGTPTTAMGVRFPSAFGLAAGFDKNAVCLLGLGALGFGHVEIG